MASGLIYEQYAEITEDATLPAGSSATPVVVRTTSGIPNTQIPLNSTTTPAMSKVATGSITFTTSTTLNLTSLPNVHGTAAQVNLNGLRPRYIEFSCPANNPASVKIAPGATNGYDWMGSDNTAAASIGRGGKLCFYPGTNATDVDAIATAADVSLDVTCSVATPAVLNYMIACG